jgi:undecaprenyl-diphosphatase
MFETRRPDRRQAWRSWWAVPALLLVLFGLLLWQVVAHGVVTRIDVHVRNGIQGAATSADWEWLYKFGRGCADLGNQAPAILTLVVVTAFTAWRARSWRPLLIAAGAGTVLATVIPLKIWVGRPGPGEAVLGDANLGFFPSGHTADAMCCYGTAAFLLATFVWTGLAARRRFAALAGILLVFTIFGLLWSNFHWLSDVLGSLCWCGAWLIVVYRYGRTATEAGRGTGEDVAGRQSVGRRPVQQGS